MNLTKDIESLKYIDELGDRLQMASVLVKGNIVEIGGGEGINTLRFLALARERKTTVFVVDPFEQIEGADKSYFSPYSIDQFYENIVSRSEYLADHLHLIQLPSQHPDIFEKLSECLPIGFMFIDGLQDKESVLSDLILAQQLGAKIICVDDYDRLTDASQVPLAVLEFLKVTMYKMINIGKREVYFIR